MQYGESEEAKEDEWQENLEAVRNQPKRKVANQGKDSENEAAFASEWATKKDTINCRQNSRYVSCYLFFETRMGDKLGH